VTQRESAGSLTLCPAREIRPPLQHVFEDMNRIATYAAAFGLAAVAAVGISACGGMSSSSTSASTGSKPAAAGGF